VSLLVYTCGWKDLRKFEKVFKLHKRDSKSKRDKEIEKLSEKVDKLGSFSGKRRADKRTKRKTNSPKKGVKSVKYSYREFEKIYKMALIKESQKGSSIN
ncbi:hypothetical protein J7K28_08250, partial [Candidatus Aerophobetes bacterium]|nr:hypothetical protein [Candidatus Aerophobetes bacterium]